MSYQEELNRHKEAKSVEPVLRPMPSKKRGPKSFVLECRWVPRLTPWEKWRAYYTYEAAERARKRLSRKYSFMELRHRPCP